MKYISSRNNKIEVSASQAIIKGISGEGGLFIPKNIPKIHKISSLVDRDYKELAYIIMKEFFTDFSEKALKDSIEKAYDKKFETPDMVSLEKVGDAYSLELYHGPTLAFKDMALSILPYLLKESIKINGIEKEVVILTATSGDTGKAALEGFANVDGIKIIVFYPKNGVSQVQRLQMITQEGDNTFVVAIDGNFDDAQTGVKNIFKDKNFQKSLDENGYSLSSANSINIGRLVPQIVYYFYSYLTLLRRGEIDPNEKINVCVPTGNFGNILAAFYAKEMGLPIGKLICASNENNVLTDFFNKKTYDINRKLILTSSPSMDILVSSNLERLLSHLSNEDDKFINEKMDSLKKDKSYDVDLNLGDFYSDYSNEDEIKDTIKDLYQEYNYLADPHTAVAFNVYKKYKEGSNDNNKTVIASTASPFKFGKKVAESLGIDIANRDDFQILEEIEKITGMPIPQNIKSLKEKKLLHKNTSDKDAMKEIIACFLKVGGAGV